MDCPPPITPEYACIYIWKILSDKSFIETIYNRKKINIGFNNRSPRQIEPNAYMCISTAY